MRQQSNDTLQDDDARPAPRRRAATILAVAGLLLFSTVPVFASADLPGDASGTLAAIFPPGGDPAAALAAVTASGGLIVRGGGWGSVLVVRSDEAGFARRLRQAGAWLVVDPQSAAGCLVAGSFNARS